MFRIKEFLDFGRNPRIPYHQEDLKLKGKVKSVEYRVYTAYAKGEALIKGRTKEHLLTHFDKLGRYTEVIDFCDATKALYHYHENNTLAKIEECNEHGECYLLETFRYDEKGNMVEHKEAFPDGSLWGRMLYRYNRQGQLVASDDVEEKSKKPFIKKRYIYKGNTVLQRSGGKILKGEGETYTYNENQQLIKVEWRHYKYFDFTYDERGNLLEYKEKYEGNNEVNEFFKFQYDEHDNIIEKYHDKRYIKKKLGKEHTIYQYEYDAHGNWTKKMVFCNGDIEDVILRKIEYFD